MGGASDRDTVAVDERAAAPRRSRSLIYVETSALLTWLFHEPLHAEVQNWLQLDADFVTSELTFLEANRALVRLWMEGVDDAHTVAMRSRLGEIEAAWWIVTVETGVLDAGKYPFRIEPVRSLDAIHLASARLVQAGHPESILFLALDKRVRVNGIAERWNVVPLPTDEEWRAAERVSRPKRKR